MVKKEWILTLAMLLVGVVFMIGSLRLGLGNVRRPGTGFLPFYTGLGLSCVALVYLFKTFLAAKRERRKVNEEFFGRSVLNVVAIFMALIVYVLLFPLLGYVLSTFLLLIFLFKAGGVRRWTSCTVDAFLAVSLSYLLFCFWLNMRFPKGFLGF